MDLVKSYIEEQRKWSHADAVQMVTRAVGHVDRWAIRVYDLGEVDPGAVVWLVAEDNIRGLVLDDHGDRSSSWVVTSGSWGDRLYLSEGMLRRFGPGNDRPVTPPSFLLFV